MKHEDSSYGKKNSSYKNYKENSRKGADSKKLAYNFQPSFNPVFLPSVKTPYKPTGLGHQPLPKPKQLIPGPAIYKYWMKLIFYIWFWWFKIEEYKSFFHHFFFSLHFFFHLIVVLEFENTFNNLHFGRSWLKSTKPCPVIHHKSSSNHIRPSIDSPCTQGDL